ncbi:pyridine nucleotide-disulfide oxidoreductase domain-containing protein 2 family protein [Cooperia oncophora]
MDSLRHFYFYAAVSANFLQAAYLARAGKSVCVLERRGILGGAAVTEEIIPGFKFSRASYLLSLLRPVVINDLKLKEHGLRYHIRNPSSFTPIRNSDKSLLLGLDMKENCEEIAKFSKRDAEMFPKYEEFIQRIVGALEPLMDQVPLNMHESSKRKLLKSAWRQFRIVRGIGLSNTVDFYELMTAPIAKVMNKWFESDVLKATLGTDGVIGFAASPYDSGTGYVLLHHVLGGLDNRSGTWGYVMGGMGAVSEAIAKAATSHGAELFTDQEVDSILVENRTAKGVRLSNGKEVHANTVLSNATPRVTFEKLLNESDLSPDFLRSVKSIDYTSPVTKINVAVRELPSFSCRPNTSNTPQPHHQTTVHLNCESMDVVHEGVRDFRNGHWSRRPVIEMTIPSVVDRSLVPDDSSHVISLFTQCTPYSLEEGPWNEERKEQYAKHVFNEIDCYAPNFSSSVIGYEVLPPPEIERIFGLTGGNIFHGSMTLDQLYFSRPVARFSDFRTPITGLFLLRKWSSSRWRSDRSSGTTRSVGCSSSMITESAHCRCIRFSVSQTTVLYEICR